MGGPGGRTASRVLAGPGAALVVAYAWWAVGRPPFSASATAAVVGAGAAAMALGAVPPRRPRRGPVGTAVPWAAVALAAGAWQLSAYLQHPRADHPTLSSLANALLDSRPARALAFLAWLAVAVHLGRR